MWGCVFSVYPLPCDDWENKCTLSYYHHQIGSLNYYPLFRVRSWNNGVRCMSFYIFIANMLIFSETRMIPNHFNQLYSWIISYVFGTIYNSPTRYDIHSLALICIVILRRISNKMESPPLLHVHESPEMAKARERVLPASSYLVNSFIAPVLMKLAT